MQQPYPHVEPGTFDAPDWSQSRTFYLAPENWHEPFVLEGSEAHHLVRVLRIRAGDDVRLLDGKGREGAFRVSKSDRHKVWLDCLGVWEHPQPANRVILAAGWTKAARRGWILEKAVEFEAAGIWLWQAERSQFPVPADIREAWQGQLIAGAKQCRNPWLPELRTFPGGVADVVAAAAGEPLARRHMLVESDHGPTRHLTPGELAVPGVTLCVVGPEGGFTPGEVRAFAAAGFEPLTLGERVLRWETAAVLCLGLHWWASELPL